jgi:hypothetical protein
MLLIDALLEVGEVELSGKVAACGSILVYGAPAATVHSTGHQHRHMGNLAHCGRFQVCPACTPFIMARRLEALHEVGVNLAGDANLRHFMVVISIRHRRGSGWKELVKTLRKMQAAVRRGHPWRDAVVGFIRLLESTYRHKNGHHPHEHIILSMRVSDDFEPVAFFRWVHATCKLNARKARRSCEFTGEWWSEIPRDLLAKAINYLGTADKMGTSDVPDDGHAPRTRNPLNELRTTTKHQPLWTIPPKAYAEVWRDSFRMRWFGVGGVWRSQKTAKSDEGVEKEREQLGDVIAHIPGAVWRSWPAELRRQVRVMVSNRAIPDTDVVASIARHGGQAGPPPTPDWGDHDDG